jgi:YHS domain-containing protein
MSNLRRVLNKAFLALFVIALPAAAQVGNPGGDRAKPAIQGYDPIAYFAEGRATKGKLEFSRVWDDEQYQFASAANRDRFAGDPERYAPMFPGYCAAALSLGKIARPDPEQWLIIDGKLYLFASPTGRQKAVERPGLVKESQANWERLRKESKDGTQQQRGPM